MEGTKVNLSKLLASPAARAENAIAKVKTAGEAVMNLGAFATTPKGGKRKLKKKTRRSNRKGTRRNKTRSKRN